ncbi:MAG: NAD-dependent deacylase [Candidatus Lernaella stagnicola]|nr:NAD-dependent deacylase [Candidatus Lernaella stagnicola]
MTDLQQAVEILRAAQHVVALTGAGISVDSGIPDFRSSGGLWDRFDPMEYAHIEAFRANPTKVWEMLREMTGIVKDSRPNPGHLALAELEKIGKLRAVVTQNIDNLHQEAGSHRVIEFHGNSRHLICLFCHREFTAEEVEQELATGGVFPPRCPDDGHILKPKIVFFGEAIPMDAAAEAHAEAEDCDVMLVIGTSATVFPASGLPITARRTGSRIIEINRMTTPLTEQVAHHSLRGSSSEILPSLVAALQS